MRPRGSQGGEDLQRPLAYLRSADEENETDLIGIMELSGGAYGLQGAPRDGRDHASSDVTRTGFRRLKSDGNV